MSSFLQQTLSVRLPELLHGPVTPHEAGGQHDDCVSARLDALHDVVEDGLARDKVALKIKKLSVYFGVIL